MREMNSTETIQFAKMEGKDFYDQRFWLWLTI